MPSRNMAADEEEERAAAQEPPDRDTHKQQKVMQLAQAVRRQERAQNFHNRYTRLDEVLGKGAFKTVYKGFDTQEGIEVAWNLVRLSDLVMQPQERERLQSEIRVLKNLKHNNIMAFYDYLVNEEDQTVSFITELFTSGTLRQYRKKRKTVELIVLKRWAWQILQGLVYLHGMNPPVMHRDLKCDNIFVNGNSGQVKIGDLGLATRLKEYQQPQSVLGTPEFMAPELYDEKYDTKVDVYAFGMCLLELATRQYPYSECQNAAQIYKKVIQGTKPESLKLVEQTQLREFIELCITRKPDLRPTSRQLLKHSFFDDVRIEGQLERIAGLAHSHEYQKEEEQQPAASEFESNRSLGSASAAKNEDHGQQEYHHHQNGHYIPNGVARGSYHGEGTGGHSFADLDGTDVDKQFKIKVQMQEQRHEQSKVNFTVRIYHQDAPTIIEFLFDLENDTAESISDEMMTELNLSEAQAHIIADHIQRSVRHLLPHTPRNGTIEMKVKVSNDVDVPGLLLPPSQNPVRNPPSDHALEALSTAAAPSARAPALSARDGASADVNTACHEVTLAPGEVTLADIKRAAADTPAPPSAAHSAVPPSSVDPGDIQGHGHPTWEDPPAARARRTQEFTYAFPPDVRAMERGNEKVVLVTQEQSREDDSSDRSGEHHVIVAKQRVIVGQTGEGKGGEDTKVTQLNGYLQDALLQSAAQQGTTRVARVGSTEVSKAPGATDLDAQAQRRLELLKARPNSRSTQRSAEASIPLSQVPFKDMQRFLEELYQQQDEELALLKQSARQGTAPSAQSDWSTGVHLPGNSPEGVSSPEDGRGTPTGQGEVYGGDHVDRHVGRSCMQRKASYPNGSSQLNGWKHVSFGDSYPAHGRHPAARLAGSPPKPAAQKAHPV